MTHSLVSVILPCYNAMPFLPEALESILNQTYTNLEIICINDGSTDETGKVLEEYAEKDKRIRLIHNQANLKLISTLNKGVQLAKGEFIARMDADDVSDVNRMQIQVDFLRKNPNTDIVSTGANLISEEGKSLGENKPRNFSVEATNFASYLFRPIGHAEILSKSKVLKENPYVQEEHTLHTEDYELWSRLIRKNYNLANLTKSLYSVRINSNSVSRKYTNVQDENFWRCLKQHHDKSFDVKLTDSVAKIVANRIHSKPKFSDVKGALILIKSIENKFSKNYHIRKNEIQYVYKTHVADIIYQVIKKGGFKLKVYSIYFILFKINILFSIKTLKYIFSKFKRSRFND